MNIAAFSKTYEQRKVLDFPGMTLEAGKIYAVIGANGSGKSTFGRVLAGIEAADRNQKPTGGISVGYMLQKNYAYRMSTAANILLNNPRERKLANHLMDRLQIRHLEHKRANKLSGGETARMSLARLMMRPYNLAILDEPTAAMDMETTLLSEQLIVDYARQKGCALILITHSLQQARRVADEIWYFHKGQLLEWGPTGQLLSCPAKEETRQFLEFYGMA